MNEKEKRWVEMGMLVVKRWGVLDGSNYICRKGDKVESTHANRASSFFFLFFEKKKIENLKIYEWFLEMLHIAVNLS